jgi:hypothetical protein
MAKIWVTKAAAGSRKAKDDVEYPFYSNPGVISSSVIDVCGNRFFCYER